MRWQLIKAAWGLAREAFPDKRVYVTSPARVAPEGDMEVVDLSDGKTIGKVAYRARPEGRMVLSLNDKSREVNLPREGILSYKIRKAPRSPNEIQHGLAKSAGAAKKKYKAYEKVRIIDPRSMEFGEMGQVLTSASRGGERYYLVTVDGSSKPLWFAEGSLAQTLVGAVIYRP
jgi:hypothetical protein